MHRIYSCSVYRRNYEESVNFPLFVFVLRGVNKLLHIFQEMLYLPFDTTLYYIHEDITKSTKMYS